MTTLDLSTSTPAQAQVDALIVPVFSRQGKPHVVPSADSQGLDTLFNGAGVASVAASLGASGAASEVTKIPTLGGLVAPVVATLGVGTSDHPDAHAWAVAVGSAIRALAGTAHVAVLLPTQANDDPAVLRAIAEAALLAAYTFTEFRSAAPTASTDAGGNAHLEPVQHITLLAQQDNAQAAAIIEQAQIIATAVHLTRDLVNTPPSHLHPSELAQAAQQVGSETGVDVQVLDENALEQGGYGGILGVGQGSIHPPRLVTMTYAPSAHGNQSQTGNGPTDKPLPHLALVGKGITFDSGGLSLKPATAMETMKLDMAGAAAVIAALGAIARLKLPIKVTGLAAIAENLPSGTAQRPSDVLTTRAGTTVEVLNTDAEGRLVLADALVDACALNPDLIVDVATLTGAQMIALGNRTSAIMANDDTVRAGIAAAADAAGESMWPMPLPPELRKSLDSPVADIANMGDRYGGMLVAGVFLQEFITEGQLWAHLDIAGPAFNTGQPWGYTPKQATGVATRTLIEIAVQLSRGQFELPARPDQPAPQHSEGDANQPSPVPDSATPAGGDAGQVAATHASTASPVTPTPTSGVPNADGGPL